MLKKASDLGSEFGKQAQKAAEKLSETTSHITDTAAFKKVSEVCWKQVEILCLISMFFFCLAFKHDQRRS